MKKTIIFINKWMVISLSFIIYHLSFSQAVAQQYTGMGGLIHVPSAEMDSAGTAKIGIHYVDKHMIPDKMTCDKEKFNSATNYLSVTPFRWMEIGYGYTLWKMHYNLDKTKHTGFYSKDRYFSLRINPLYETEYLPSIVIGGNDIWGSKDDGQSVSNFYRNYYVSATKHFNLNGHIIATHLTYRKWTKDYNKKWNGLVGGVTYRPQFYQPLRFIGEYDGNSFNIGADCLLLRHILIQASLQECRYFSGGICYQINLL
jgi:hypothetical protein